MSNKVKVPGGAFYAGDGLTVDSVTRTVSAGGGDVTTPDWNQNDETAHDYVKNRPFYMGNPVETVLVEEITVEFEDSSSEFQSTFEATVGETYKVYWDDIAYECACVSFNGIPVIGNLSIIGAGTDTGEPFIMVVANGREIAIEAADTYASHTISISGMVAPVAKIDRKYLPIPFKPKGESYLTFSSPNKFILKVKDMTKHWDGTLEYFASDEAWTVWDGTSILSAITNDGEYVLYLRGTKNTVITGDSNGGWSLDGNDIKCIGNIENLLDYATVESGAHPGMSDSCYYSMFSYCNSLIQAPALPAITLARGCYSYMFRSCHNLIQAPALPATTLADSCYAYMFQGCTSLTQAPALPATTLADNCYYYMFQNCISLTQAPALPATRLADYCYYYMFDTCINLTKAPALPATTLANYCYSFMFSWCHGLTQVPALSATTLANGCYNSMFHACTSLKLSSTKTDEYTQEYRIPSSGNGTTAANALIDMFVSTGGTFTGTPSINTTYYLSSDNIVVRETDIATLNGYVGSMIDAAIDKYECIIPSSTANSTKKFKITVDDSGTISATEVTA